MADQYCRYFDRRQCTGCTRLHEPYAQQLVSKGAAVRAELASVLGDVVPLPVVASPEPMGYRASVKLCLHEDRDRKRAIGLYRFGSKEVVNIAGCPAQTPGVNRLIAQLFARDVRLPAPFFNHRGRSFQRGRLKFVVIRCAPGPSLRSDAHGIILSHTGVSREALVKWLHQAKLAHLCAYESKLSPRDGDLPVGYHIEHLSGPPHFAFALAGHVHQLSPAAFFQANNSLAAKLVAAATGFETDGDGLLDLYGGFGAYAVVVARRFRQLTVVDGNGAAIAAARRMAATQSLGHLQAVEALCETFLEERLKFEDAARVTHVIVNPPRNGLSPRVVCRLGPAYLPNLRELHYVSCNPVTLARDLAALKPLGLTVRQIQPFDMFAQTDHVEVVARLRSGGAS